MGFGQARRDVISAIVAHLFRNRFYGYVPIIGPRNPIPSRRHSIECRFGA